MPRTYRAKTKEEQRLATPEELADYRILQEEIRYIIANTHKPFIDAFGLFVMPKLLLNFLNLFTLYKTSPLNLLSNAFCYHKNYPGNAIVDEFEAVFQKLLKNNIHLEHWHKFFSPQAKVILESFFKYAPLCHEVASNDDLRSSSEVQLFLKYHYDAFMTFCNNQKAIGDYFIESVKVVRRNPKLLAERADHIGNFVAMNSTPFLQYKCVTLSSNTIKFVSSLFFSRSLIWTLDRHNIALSNTPIAKK